MYEFVIMYKATGENDRLYGRDFPDALRQAGVARDDVVLLSAEEGDCEMPALQKLEQVFAELGELIGWKIINRYSDQVYKALKVDAAKGRYERAEKLLYISYDKTLGMIEAVAMMDEWDLDTYYDLTKALHDFHHGQILPIIEGWKK